jgi:hypothetical protein
MIWGHLHSRHSEAISREVMERSELDLHRPELVLFKNYPTLVLLSAGRMHPMLLICEDGVIRGPEVVAAGGDGMGMQAF